MTEVLDLGDVAMTMVVISDVADVAGTTGVGEEERGRAMVT